MTYWIDPAINEVKLYPGEYAITVVFIRSQGDDAAVLGCELTPQAAAVQLAKELQEDCDQCGSVAGRFQVGSVMIPEAK